MALILFVTITGTAWASQESAQSKLETARENLRLSQATYDRIAASKQNSEVQNIIEGKLDRALQELTEEMKRLQKERPRQVSSSIGGIPVDSEYILFIIGTSGSMQSKAWGYLQEKMQETLNIYPRVKGIQIMNDDGIYMFPQYAGKGIPDTPARRKAILKVLCSWRPFSNSSPVEGILEARAEYHDPSKKISLYVSGDEFAGEKMRQVVETVDRMDSEKPVRRVPAGSGSTRSASLPCATIRGELRESVSQPSCACCAKRTAALVWASTPPRHKVCIPVAAGGCPPPLRWFARRPMKREDVRHFFGRASHKGA